MCDKTITDMKLKITVNVNSLDNGGYSLICKNNDSAHNYVGVVVFNNDGNAISTTAGLYFPKECEFQPGKSYISILYLVITPTQMSKLKVGNIIELRVGLPQNNANWAKCEIMEILDD